MFYNVVFLLYNKVKKKWNASRTCVSSLCRDHADLLCIVPILVYVLPKRALSVVLIYISLMINDVDHYFNVLIYHCISSLMKCLFTPFAHFLKIKLFSYWVLRGSYVFQIQVLYQIYALQRFFSSLWHVFLFP